MRKDHGLVKLSQHSLLVSRGTRTVRMINISVRSYKQLDHPASNGKNMHGAHKLLATHNAPLSLDV